MGGDEPLRELDGDMARNLYLSRRVLRKSAEVQHALEAKIRSSIRANGVLQTVEMLANETKPPTTAARLETAVRLDIRARTPFEPLFSPRFNMRTSQSAIDRAVRTRKSSVTSILWPVPDRNEWVLQMHRPFGDVQAGAACVATAFELSRQMWERSIKRASYFDDFEQHDLFFAQIASYLIEASLRQAATERLRFEWDLQTSGAGRAAIGTRGSVRRLLAKSVKTAAEPRLSELSLLTTVLRRRPASPALVGVGNLVAYKENSPVPAFELDGIVIEERSKSLVITIIEAKTGRQVRPSDAPKQLRRLSNYLNAPPVRVSPVVPMPSPVAARGSYAKVTFSIPY
jgi:hypothetical protein